MNKDLIKDLMMITAVEVEESKIWEGAKVRNRNGEIREIFVVPDGKTISECAREGSFIPSKHVDYTTFALNSRLFTYDPADNEEL